MGQKVNPNGMRVGINKQWNSRWYANEKDYHIYLNEDIKIREFIKNKYKSHDSGLSYVEIERTKTDRDGIRTKITIHTSNVGPVLGEKGANVKLLEDQIAVIIKKCSGNQPGRVQVVGIEKNDVALDARLVAAKICKQLEERASFRTVQKMAIREVRKAGAEGCRTLLSGRLGGAEIARSEGYKEGKIPLQTLRSDIDYAVDEAATIYGKIGVKVWIYRGEKSKSKQDKEGE